MLLDGIPNWQQRREDDCLVARCKQVLDHLGITRNEAWLWRQLASSGVTPFPNIANLANALGLVVEIHTDGILDRFEAYIESGLPVIVAVDADDPLDWPYVRHHAVVVIGFDDQHVFVNDPAQAETGREVALNTFMLAWSRRNYDCAIIGLT